MKVRYNDEGAPASVWPETDGVVVEFDEPVSAITPGQLAAFYIQDELGSRIAGGGWIDRTVD